MKALWTLSLIALSALSVKPAVAAQGSPMDPKWFGPADSSVVGTARAPTLPPLPGESAARVGVDGVQASAATPRLGGVMVSVNGSSSAVLDGQVVQNGSRHGAWTLTAITSSGVTLKSGDQALHISLFSNNAASSGLQMLTDSKISPAGRTASGFDKGRRIEASSATLDKRNAAQPLDASKRARQ